jgi:uncharacterized protein
VISFDTNILFPALEPTHSNHQKAKEFLLSLQGQKIALCELVLIEVYQLIRNPKICIHPLDEKKAFEVIQAFRSHPEWELIDYPGNLMEEIWQSTREVGFPRRKIFDVRLARTLIHAGVRDFATGNERDFVGMNFRRVWNPF